MQNCMKMAMMSDRESKIADKMAGGIARQKVSMIVIVNKMVNEIASEITSKMSCKIASGMASGMVT